MIQDILQATLLKDLMATPPIVVHERDEFHVVHEKFVVYDIRHLPVVNEVGVLTGLISQRDLYKIHSPRRLEDGSWYYDKDTLDSFLLKNVMHKNPFTLSPEHSLKDALGPMVLSKFGCVTVIDSSHRPLGVITRVDILKFFLNHN